jgi:hypothetical protein
VLAAAHPPAAPDGRAFVDPAQRRPKYFIAGAAVRFKIHERMNDTDNRKSRSSGAIGDRSFATIRVPPENFFGEAQAPQCIRAGGKLQATRWHLKDVRTAGSIEHVGALEKMRERLAVLAVADKPEARRRRHVARDAVHVAAAAAQGKV